ncbi:MAG: DUF4258 domain-containing protein [Dehalococcoidia bacterium]
MKPTYSVHARLRMWERDITEHEIETVLTDYHSSCCDDDGNPIYVGHPQGRRVVVVVSLGSNPPHIITVWD